MQKQRYNLLVISVVQLGTVSYSDGLRLQQKLVELRKAGEIGDVLLLLEHTPVITLGRNAKTANILMPAEQLAMRGVELFETDRGGDVTFHGPGQIVGYPIFDLRGFSRDTNSSKLQAPSSQESRSQVSGVRSQEGADEREASFLARRGTLGAVDYVRRLEEVLIRTCADFGIVTKRVAGLTGVWTETGRGSRDSKGSRDPGSLGFARDFGAQLGRRASASTSTRQDIRAAREDPASLRMTGLSEESKIAAIGVHISRSVTSHGFALNVNTDLSYFDLIVPCGIVARQVTSMEKELGRKVDMEKVTESISRNFGVVFGREMVWVESLETLLGRTVGVPMKMPRELRKIRGEDEVFLA